MVFHLITVFLPSQTASSLGKGTVFVLPQYPQHPVPGPQPRLGSQQIFSGWLNECVNSELELHAYVWSPREVIWAFALSDFVSSGLHCFLRHVYADSNTIRQRLEVQKLSSRVVKCMRMSTWLVRLPDSISQSLNLLLTFLILTRKFQFTEFIKQ